MRISRISVKNFRLLKDVELSLEDKTTVIVGRNNSGKTSLTELFWRVLSGKAQFSLEDFTLSVHEEFWDAFILLSQGAEQDIVRDKLPAIEARLYVAYDQDTADLGTLGEFIIDLDSATTEAVALIGYRLRDGMIGKLFDGLSYSADGDIAGQKTSFFKLMRERVPKLYSVSLFALDPTDSDNIKPLELSKLRDLVQAGFINAQRGLDDVTYKERDVLGRALSRVLDYAASDTASPEDRALAQELEGAVSGIQEKIGTDFQGQLDRLLPTLELFGYPGLNDPKLSTETTLSVEALMADTKICYEGANGIGLPESYNGLGSRNLIYILFQLYDFFREYKKKETAPGLHLVFLEEPEAHLHPQMMEVFIRQLSTIANAFATRFNRGEPWPVQFVVTTHSTHIANEAPFQAIRYFLCARESGQQTRIKDLREGLGDHSFDEDREFLHKYLTLTRCDLFFADKAILIEGPTERLMYPKMRDKVEADATVQSKLSSQYVSIIEVGGAYAHHFFKLLEFLELRTIIITDLDSVDSSGGSKCKVANGTHTSNVCIQKWFNDNQVSPATLIAKPKEEKSKDFLRLAYQIPESGCNACGRSFEDAFMLANGGMFEIEGQTDAERANSAWEKAKNVDKTDFAIEHALDKTDWVVPAYIKEGLIWLAESPCECISESISSPPESSATLEEVS